MPATSSPSSPPSPHVPHTLQPPGGILIASADAGFRRLLSAEAGGQARQAISGADALAQLEYELPAAVWLDRKLPDLEAGELAAMLRRLHPAVAVRLVEAGGGPSSPAPGAAPEPVPCAAGATPPGLAPPASWVGEAPLAEPLPGMRGSGPAMRELFRLARRVAPRDTAVLISGESGTGKELVARALHQLSRRAQQPWVVVNCAALPESLLEAELFGHARGAFTGAVQAQLGRIHAAHRGTLFLDEIGELPLGMQAKLLRFVQEGEVQRLGSPDVFRVDVRLLAATNADLERRVEEGRFRADLYYRLSVFPLELPPLRQRGEDVPVLAADLIAALCRKNGIAPTPLSPAAVSLLAAFPWPGNVRQLQHALERALILSDSGGVIEPAHLPLALRRFAAASPRRPHPPAAAGSEFANPRRLPIGSQAAWA